MDPRYSYSVGLGQIIKIHISNLFLGDADPTGLERILQELLLGCARAFRNACSPTAPGGRVGAAGNVQWVFWVGGSVHQSGQ